MKVKTNSRTHYKDLLFRPVSAWENCTPAETKAIDAYAQAYKRFLGSAKTERECIEIIEKRLQREKFKPLHRLQTLSKGDRVYKNIKGRALIAARIGNPQQPWRIVGSHVDSPRLDLKPNPLFEDGNLAMLQTHYYGGIKKYQWVNVPLSMHAVIHTRQGVRTFVVGEKEGEPRFMIPDMPPHLGKEQMAKSAREAVLGEQLRIVVGNRPLPKTKENEKVKLAVLDWLHKKYGIVEKDFLTADISFVPAAAPVDVGFDQSCLAAYGQDDRACVFATLEAACQSADPQGVAVALFVDKEEIGSFGDTSAQSRLLDIFTEEIRQKLRLKKSTAAILESATALSADVTEALNPNFKEISDVRNSSRLGGGVSIEKYGGGGGKYSTNEASGDYMSWLTRLLEKQKIKWQTGEFGRLDLGGGGTIAMYLSRYGMDTIDVGPPLLSMHSTQELASKVDVYFAYRCYQHFFQV
ncbi:aminopeptidase [bacterium]|nr:aminopeptidase [bacterium]